MGVGYTGKHPLKIRTKLQVIETHPLPEINYYEIINYEVKI